MRFLGLAASFLIVSFMAWAGEEGSKKGDEFSFLPTDAFISSAGDEAVKISAKTDDRYYLRLRRISESQVSRYVLMKWDLTADMINGRQIVSARVVCHVSPESYDTTGELHVGMFSLKRSWDVNAVTWNEAGAGDAWEIPGAGGENDIGAQIAEAVVSVDGISSATVQFDIPVGVVQGWLRDADTNHGVLLKFVEGGDDLSMSLYSSIRPREEVRLAPALILGVK